MPHCFLKQIIMMMAAFVTVFACSNVAQARVMAYPEVQKIIILPLSYAGGDRTLEALGVGMSDLLTSSLSAYQGLTVIDRTHLHKVMKELGTTASGFNIERAPKLGKLLQANRLLKGSFLIEGDIVHAHIGVYDIGTTQLVTQVEQKGKLADIADVAAQASESLAKALLHGQRRLQELPVDSTPQVNLHFMRGLGHFYSGLHDHAIADFMQALDLDTSHADSRYWLVRSYLAGQAYDHARIELKRFVVDFPDDSRRAELADMLKQGE